MEVLYSRNQKLEEMHLPILIPSSLLVCFSCLSWSFLILMTSLAISVEIYTGAKRLSFNSTVSRSRLIGDSREGD